MNRNHVFESLKMNRRETLKKLGWGIASTPFLNTSLFAHPSAPKWQEKLGGDRVTDEAFWKRFRKEHYDISKDFINLENGYFGVHPKSVTQAYIQNIKKVNQFSSHYMRTSFWQEFEKIKARLADFAGVLSEELLITRNATEAMNILIQGLNLKRGDEVILHRQDYGSMIEAFQMLERQKGIKLKFIRIPLIPESDEQLISLYQDAITPATRCVLLTHMIHLTGQIMPVKKIAQVVKEKGIDVIVDAAHSFAQLDFKLPDLAVDFIGVNLHKWFSNPLGAGMLYVKKERIKDVKPLFADAKRKENDIRKLGHFGTLATPILMTIPTALQFNQEVTISLKERRLRYLQNYWTKQLQQIPKVSVCTPTSANRSCAIASFKIDGMAAQTVVDQLFKEYQVFTVIRQLEDEQVVRVTPNLYNHPKELDVLLEGVQALART